MKFSLDCQNLGKTLSLISNQVLPKPTLPILGNILLEAEKNYLKISATNLELGIILETEAKIAKTGKTTLPIRVLTDLILSIGEGEISFELVDSEVEIKAGSQNSKIPTISAEEFPSIPQPTKLLTEIEGLKLVEALGKVIFAASQDSGRPILTGVLVEVLDTETKLVATDGYRLSFEKIIITKSSQERSLIIPAKTLSQLAKVIAENNHSLVRVFQDEAVNQVGFGVGKTFLVSRLVEGVFPDWQKIIPANFKTHCSFLKSEFLQALKVASVFARDAGNTVRLNFGKKLEISAQSVAGSSKTEVAAKISGEELETAFNWRYLTEALKVMPEDVEMDLVESLTPTKLSPTKKSDFFHIIMPVRIT